MSKEDGLQATSLAYLEVETCSAEDSVCLTQASMLLEEAAGAAGKSGPAFEGASVLGSLLSGDCFKLPQHRLRPFSCYS